MLPAMAKPTKAKDQAERDILAQARDDWDAAWEREQDNIRLAYDDLAFLAADNYSQWPADQRKKREEECRPVLQINELPQFVHQITGDIRQMRPAIKVVPVDSGSDEKIASLRGGLIHYRIRRPLDVQSGNPHRPGRRRRVGSLGPRRIAADQRRRAVLL
jgi:hypothetical protein